MEEPNVNEDTTTQNTVANTVVESNTTNIEKDNTNIVSK